MQFCPRCSKPLLPQANYCRRCGYAVQRPRPSIPSRQRCHPFAGFIVVALAMSVFGSLMRSNRNYWHPVTAPQEMRWHDHSRNSDADRPLTPWSPVHRHRIFPETGGRLSYPPEEHHRFREYYRPFTVSPQAHRERVQRDGRELPAESTGGQVNSDAP